MYHLSMTAVANPDSVTIINQLAYYCLNNQRFITLNP